MPTVIPTAPSAEMHIALKWIEAYNNWDIDQALSLATDDYTHYTLPESLGILPRNKKEFEAYFKNSVSSLFTGFKVTVHEIMELPGKIVFYATSTATSTTGFPYANEYMITVHFTTQADGRPRISAVKEFVDSKASMEFFSAERKRQAAKHSAQTA